MKRLDTSVAKRKCQHNVTGVSGTQFQQCWHFFTFTLCQYNVMTLLNNLSGTGARSAPSHYLNQCQNIVNWTFRNKLRWNFIRNSYIFIKNAFKNVVCEMEFILPWPQYVDIYSSRVKIYWLQKVPLTLLFTRSISQLSLVITRCIATRQCTQHNNKGRTLTRLWTHNRQIVSGINIWA